MGSYSWTDFCDIQIREGKREEFLKYLEDLQHESRDDWIEWGQEHAQAITVDDDNVEIIIDNWKIISYWYPTTLEWFDKLSDYLNGELHISFETPDEYAIVHFSIEGTTYELGEMQYRTYTSKQIR